MPRKQGIEYPGAVYHVISRGNYRKELFSHEKTGESFERTISEAPERCGRKVYAYVIMSNHYYLAIETQKTNLVEVRKLLQRCGTRHDLYILRLTPFGTDHRLGAKLRSVGFCSSVPPFDTIRDPPRRLKNNFFPFNIFFIIL